MRIKNIKTKCQSVLSAVVSFPFQITTNQVRTKQPVDRSLPVELFLKKKKDLFKYQDVLPTICQPKKLLNSMQNDLQISNLMHNANKMHK